jgi:hypothetical protein
MQSYNYVLCKLCAADPFCRFFLIPSYCLSLYCATLGSVSSPSIGLIEVAQNKVLRKVWNLNYK